MRSQSLAGARWIANTTREVYIRRGQWQLSGVI